MKGKAYYPVHLRSSFSWNQTQGGLYGTVKDRILIQSFRLSELTPGYPMHIAKPLSTLL